MRDTGIIGKKEKVYMPGDTLGSTVLKGSKIMWCPFCQLHLPAMFIRMQDGHSEQTIGYSCSNCNKPLVAVRRNKFSGAVVSKYSAPGYKFTK